MRTASISIQAELDIDQNLLGNARFQLFAAQRAGREFIRRARNVAVTLRRDEHQGTIASNQSSYHVKRFEKYRCLFRHVHPTGLVTVEHDGYFHEQLASGMDQLISLAFSDECVISDKGAAALSKMTNLETLVVVGFITEAGVRQLASLPSLRRLVVATSLISEDEQKELKNSIRVPSFHLVPYTGSIVMGNAGELKKRDNTEETSVQAADGILRRVVDKDGGRTALDALEGQAAPDLGGVIGDEKFDLQSLRGKVVLVEFWGTWCGPCRLLNPQLKELYGRDEYLIDCFVRGEYAKRKVRCLLRSSTLTKLGPESTNWSNSHIKDKKL